MEILHSIKNPDVNNQIENIICTELSNEQVNHLGFIRLYTPMIYKYKDELTHQIIYKFYFFSNKKVSSIIWSEFITYLFRKDHKMIINVNVENNIDGKKFLNVFSIKTSTFSNEQTASSEFDRFLKKRKGKKRLTIIFKKQIVIKDKFFDTKKTGSATTTNEEPDEGPEKFTTIL